MKLSTNTAIEVKSTTPLASQGFGVRKQDMHIILDMFRSKLYKDPIKAVCREYMCNARDAHREVNTPEKPIEITLPSPLEHQLRIQDFGPGISPRRMGDIFLFYGASTKRRSNKQTGAYGIGGKSGFAVSDTFSIISVHGGVKRHYTAFNDGKSGGVDLVHQEETTDPSGTTIVIPVKPEDMSRFAEAVVNACSYWDVRPVIHNKPATVSFPDDGPVLLEGNDWKVYSKNTYSYSNSNTLIILDGIPYPVTEADLGVKTDWVRTILGRRIHLYFKTGTLALVPSRDNILFDNKSIKRVVQRLDKIKDALYKNAVEKVADCKSLLEAELFWQEFRNTFSAKISGDDKYPVWNGIGLEGTVRQVKSSDGVFVKRFNYVNKARRSKNSDPKFVSDTTLDFRLLKESKIVWNDTDKVKGFYGKIKELLKTSRIVYFISGPNVHSWAKDNHLNELDAIRASSLPDEPKVGKTYGSGQTNVKKEVIDCWVFDPGYFGENKNHERGWRPTNVQKFLDSGVYVSSINKLAEEYDTGPNLNINGYREFKLLNDTCELKDGELYLVSRRLVKFLGPMWKSLDTVAVPILTNLLTNTTPQYISAIQAAESYMLENVSWGRARALREIAAKNPGSLLDQYVKTSDLFSKEVSNIKNVNEINQHFGYKLKLDNKNATHGEPDIVVKLKSLLDKLNEVYPMLFKDNPTKDNLDQYIQAIDVFKKPVLKALKTIEVDEPENYCAMA